MKKHICKNCGKSFKAYSSNQRIFCSIFCYRNSRKNVKLKKPEFCFVCGKEVKRRDRNKTCSFKCAGITRLGKPSWNKGRKMPYHPRPDMLGKSLHNKPHTEETKIRMSISRQGIEKEEWNGYKTQREKLERIKFRNTIQKLVLERDNYTCQICGQRGGYLQVDHIQSWSDFIELRFSIDNCRTLCMDCHYEITFGKKKPKDIIWGHNFKHLLFRKGVD